MGFNIIESFTLPSDDRAQITLIVRKLNKLAEEFSTDYLVRNTAIRITGSAKNAFGRILLLYNYVKKRVKFTSDPFNIEFVQTPKKLLQIIETRNHAYGDCDDRVVLFVSLLRAIGINAKAIGAKYHTPNIFDHVLALIVIDGENFYIDPTSDEIEELPYHELLIV